MAHIILTGATGTVGAAVLLHAISSPSIARISILSRRPVTLAENQPKARVIIHDDFETYSPELVESLKDATGVIWALGCSSAGCKEEEYKRVTVGFPVSAARAFAKAGPPGGGLSFVFVSGEGAVQPPETSKLLYGRVKGEAEKTLLELGKEGGLNVFCVRPATVNPQGKYDTERKPNLHDRLSTGLGGIFEKVWKSFVVPVEPLAGVLVSLAVGDGQPVKEGEGVEYEGRLLKNTALRRMAGL